jgi:hypothetical protein
MKDEQKAKTVIGPNVRRLIAEKMAAEIIPPGTKDPFMAAMAAIASQDMGKRAASAMTWTRAAIEEIRSARGPNPWRNSTDEEIAGIVLKAAEVNRKLDLLQGL